MVNIKTAETVINSAKNIPLMVVDLYQKIQE